MKRVVLDASVLMTFFENRPGAEKVELLIQQAMDGKRKLLMSIVNWGEIYYSVWREQGPGVAQKVIEDIARLPIELVDADYELTRQAAEMRAQIKLPYMDGFAAALAKKWKADLATSDADFVCLEPKMRIIWAK